MTDVAGKKTNSMPESIVASSYIAQTSGNRNKVIIPIIKGLQEYIEP